MTNSFQQSFEETVTERTVAPSSKKRLIALGILTIALCASYITSVRIAEASDYALRNEVHARDNAMRQYGDLGRQLDSLRSLSVISQAPVLAGFQEVQKSLYLNMDAAQSVAVANASH